MVGGERHPACRTRLKNVVTVVMDDAVLVADANRMQDVRDVVDHLEQAGVSQAKQDANDYRPWGWFESLVNMPGYQVKRLHVYLRGYHSKPSASV